MKYIVFGIDRTTHLPSKDGTGTQPTSLKNQIAMIEILDQEKYEQDDWYGVSARYQGTQVNNYLIGTGNGSTNAFTKTLQHVPVKPRNIEVTYISSSTVYTVIDDGYGTLSSYNGGSGTINYDTGYLTLSTDSYNEYKDLLGTGNGTTKTFTWHTDNNVTIFAGSILITYTIAGTTYVAKDNGVGAITGNLCSGTATYSNGTVSLTFTTAPIGKIYITYKHRTVTTPDSGTEILCKYYFNNEDTYISEAGVTDSNNNLLVYATFPRIKFKNYSFL
jgi:hypothetical protein